MKEHMEEATMGLCAHLHIELSNTFFRAQRSENWRKCVSEGFKAGISLYFHIIKKLPAECAFEIISLTFLYTFNMAL